MKYLINQCYTQNKGKYSFAISTEEYQRIVRYRFDPFCVKSTIKVTAEVRENGRGTTQSADMTIPLVANPITLSFTDDTPRSFRAGLPYTARVSRYVAALNFVPTMTYFRSKQHIQMGLMLRRWLLR